MYTLLIRLAGPMQSWGTRSRFDHRDTQLEPSKSGVLGMVCAALGRDRSQDVSDLAVLRMGVRIDRAGILQKDFHTAQNIIAADGKKIHNTALSERYYLSDAVFLVGLESKEKDILQTIHEALKTPYWSLSLGRKSFVPSPQPYFEDALHNSALEETLQNYPLLATTNANSEDTTSQITMVLESQNGEGQVRLDQPIAPFSQRKFGRRFVQIRSETFVLDSSLNMPTTTNDTASLGVT